VVDRVRDGHRRGQRGVGQPERIARPLHLGQLLPERLVLVQEHVQLSRVIVVRDGRTVGHGQQRMVAAGQLVVHLVTAAPVAVAVVMVTAAAPTRSAISPPPGRQRIEYGGLGGRGG